MNISVADPFDAVGVPPGSVATYRVRGWTNRGNASAPDWAVDEWDISGADSVEDVLAWGRGLGLDTFEIFVQWEDHAQTATGEMVARRRHTRIHGTPGEEGGVTKTVVFIKED
ncbi:hypothetical protein [Rathayibacter toxicus]|uniref:hypothetical protein n=1 Tax=Rathayibacter toxicus TaxID=145458 RepID=UPI000CE8166A|nr:hypothetical protein [Rathayibacter toxicus]PPI53919.1 hypothetical protein C5D35_08535 [Rathayibacter toxicus]QOD10939.1 hypothetical protein BSG36_02960 [Rathayibacter toxicus]QWL27674.1 hypothetical protein E2R33_02920 [Rathayibacter toxicus]QWL31900.1 hypothetical protein E2R35_02935 [Rathayibacter toxicus]QWL33994.1 hypothetical protein E2R36_02940 [Rathayibacter toxicus]